MPKGKRVKFVKAIGALTWQKVVRADGIFDEFWPGEVMDLDTTYAVGLLALHPQAFEETDEPVTPEDKKYRKGQRGSGTKQPAPEDKAAGAAPSNKALADAEAAGYQKAQAEFNKVADEKIAAAIAKAEAKIKAEYDAKLAEATKPKQ